MSLANSAARGAAATLGGQSLRFIIQLASVVILARLLSPDDYGMFAMVVSIVGVAGVLGDFGLSTAAIQKQDLSKGQKSNLFWTNFLVGVVTSAIVFVLAAPVAAFYSTPELVPIAQAISVIFFFNGLTPQFRAEVSSRMRFRSLAAADVTAQFFGLCAAVTVAVLGGGYWALVAQQIVVAVSTLCVLAIASRWLPGLPRRGQQMRPLYTYGLNALGVQVVTWATSNVDNVLVGRFWGAADLGIYTRAYQIFRLPLMQIAAPMTRVALPVLSRLQNDPRYEDYVQRAQLILVYTFGGVFFMLACVASPAIEILLGPQWDAAKPIFAVLALGGVFQAIGYAYSWIFLSRAFTGLQLRWTLLGRGAMIAMMCVGVYWGPIGVAVGSSLGQVALWLILTLFAVPKTGVNVKALVRITGRPLLVFTGMLAVTAPISWWLLTDAEAWIQLAAIIGVMVMYFGITFALSRSVRADLALIANAVRRIRRA